MNKSDTLIKHRLHPVSVLYFIATAIKEFFSFIWLFPLLVLCIHKLGGDIPAFLINITLGSCLIMSFS